jgi:hypothetical protein
MKNDAIDAKIPVGLLLPVWLPQSYKMSATGFLKGQPNGGHSHPQFKAAIEPTILSRMTLPIQYVQDLRIALKA